MKTTISELRRTVRKIIKESSMTPEEEIKYQEGYDQGQIDAETGHGRDIPPRRRFKNPQDHSAYVQGYNDGYNSI